MTTKKILHIGSNASWEGCTKNGNCYTSVPEDMSLLKLSALHRMLKQMGSERCAFST